jgi:hypothetical protein
VRRTREIKGSHTEVTASAQGSPRKRKRVSSKRLWQTIVLQLLSSTGEAHPGVAPNAAFVRVMEPESHVAATVNRTHCPTADKYHSMTLPLSVEAPLERVHGTVTGTTGRRDPPMHASLGNTLDTIMGCAACAVVHLNTCSTHSTEKTRTSHLSV